MVAMYYLSAADRPGCKKKRDACFFRRLLGVMVGVRITRPTDNNQQVDPSNMREILSYQVAVDKKLINVL
jgi:hypothetical protein